MQRRALGACGVADRNGGEEIGLAFDRGGARAGADIRHRGGAAERVGERHDGAAVQDAVGIVVHVPHRQLALDPLRRNVGDLDAKEIGVGRRFRLVGAAFHGYSR